ncbi:hypothetical protein [Roseomonas fluvialis]|nr:hypothetical protein [Roseomonas fluvialis]
MTRAARATDDPRRSRDDARARLARQRTVTEASAGDTGKDRRMNGNDEAPRLGRRLLVLRTAAVGAAAAPLAGCVVAPPAQVYAPARTGLTDADPGDGPGQGRGGYAGSRRTGLTDADPSDGPGQGRGGYRGPARTGLTDADPNDGPGQGRGGYRARGGTGVTDADPSDGPGQGRGGRTYRRQVSDSDPRDAPGRGRGW